MSTLDQLVTETKHRLLSGQTENLNKLALPASAGAGSLALQYDVQGINRGTTVEIDYELFYAWGVTPATKTVTVDPAYQGSGTDAHVQGSLVTVSPFFPRFSILTAMNETLLDLSSRGLYQVHTIDLTYQPPNVGYDLGIADITDVYRVEYEVPNGFNQWPRMRNWRFSRQEPTVDFPSGNVLFVNDGAFPGFGVRVHYRQPFIAALAHPADDVAAVTGLPASAHDLLVLGASVRLLAPREIKRNFTETQGDTRRATEVPPGAVAASSRGVAALYEARLKAELARQENLYPMRKRGA